MNEMKTIELMMQYGGSFVRALAACFLAADPDNFRRLKAAFPELWQRYEDMGNARKEGAV